MLFRFLPKRFLARQFRKPSGLYGRLYMARFFNKGNRGLESFMHEVVAPQPGEKLLEVGPGNGRLLAEMLPDTGDSGKIDAIDLSPVMIRQFRNINKAAIASGRVSIQKAGIEQIPFGEQSFDKVYTNNTLYFWPDQEQCMREVFRVLKIGGTFFCGFRTPEQVKNISIIADSGVFQMRSPEEVQALYEQAGFTHITIHSREEKPFDSYIASGVKSGNR